MRSLFVLGAAAALFLVFLVKNERNAQEMVRAEDAAVGRLEALVKGPPGPPFVEGEYRFQWVEGGGLPAVLFAFPDGAAISLFAAAPDGSVYAYEIFEGMDPPEPTPLRVHVARAAAGPPPGWRKVR